MYFNTLAMNTGDLVSGSGVRYFTYEKYDQLITAAVERDDTPPTVRSYFSSDTLPDRFAVFRHDVDREPENKLNLARIETDSGVIQSISSLGDETGYHYDDPGRADSSVELAHQLFAANLGKLQTVCMHGRPLAPQDNRDIGQIRIPDTNAAARPFMHE